MSAIAHTLLIVLHSTRFVWHNPEIALPGFLQVNAAAQFTGTTAEIGSLVTAAAVPCGSIVRIYGQSSSPMAFSCLPVPVSQQLPVGPQMETRARSILSVPSLITSPEEDCLVHPSSHYSHLASIVCIVKIV